MKNRKMIVGLMAMTVFVGVGVISARLGKQKEGFFETGSSNKKDECVTVTHQNEGQKEENNTDEVIDEFGKDEHQGDECVTVTQEEECVTVTQQEDESGADVSEAEINWIEVNVHGMKDEVKAQIEDYDAFLFAIKECFYRTGVMETEVTSLNKVSHDYNDNLVHFSMYVKSQTLTDFDVTYDLGTGRYFVQMD